MWYSDDRGHHWVADNNSCDTQPVRMAEHYAEVAAAGKPKIDKLDMSLLGLLPNALNEVVRALAYGAIKHSRDGFLVDGDYGVYTAKMLRHYFASQIEGDCDLDPKYDEPGCEDFKGKVLHDAQVAANALIRLEIKLRDKENENRNKV